MRKTDWKEYFVFSKRERVAVIVLLTLIVLFIIIPFFYHPFQNKPQPIITTLDQELSKKNIDTSAVSADASSAYEPSDESEAGNKTLFAFDPNTIDAAGFKQLGLRDKTINTIINYRSKGGHFRQPEDLRKIYGLTKEASDRLIPYVHIASKQVYGKNEQALTHAQVKPAIINVNTATLEQWKALPAIGDALAGRIVKFRDKMGGFKSIAQVKQTYGLSDSAFNLIAPYLTITAAQQHTDIDLKKININTATVQQLQSNTNIPEEVAKAIVIYRSQHGNYASVEGIRKIVFINDEIYNKIAPYLSTE